MVNFITYHVTFYALIFGVQEQPIVYTNAVQKDGNSKTILL